MYISWKQILIGIQGGGEQSDFNYIRKLGACMKNNVWSITHGQSKAVSINPKHLEVNVAPLLRTALDHFFSLSIV